MTKKPKLKTINYKLITIVGPTASGKTDLSIRLAKKFNGEIVSADSRQVYKKMDIGTAKPLRTQKEVRHHLIDTVYPNEEFNAAIFKNEAVKIIKNIQKRQKIPFLVGGTGLYVWAVIDNLDFPAVPCQKKLREKLEKKSTAELFEIYKKLDPQGEKFIEKENKRRLVRAIEVCESTSKSFWEQRKKKKPLFEILELGIKIPKEKLEKRIIKRVQKMFDLGLEKEVKVLVKKYGWIPSLQTIGYQEWKEYFEGKIKKNDVKNLIVQHTIQFAKRQMTWFKRDNRIHWIKSYPEAEKLAKKFFLC